MHRHILALPLLFACLPGLVAAAERDFSMAGQDAAESASPGPSASTESSSSTGSRIEGLTARYLVSQDDALPRGNAVADPASTPAAAATTPSGSTLDKRVQPRWQSLVPGAIK